MILTYSVSLCLLSSYVCPLLYRWIKIPTCIVMVGNGFYPTLGGHIEHARSNGRGENTVLEEHNGGTAEEVALEYLALV